MNIDSMTVEQRTGQSHGLRAPMVEGSPEYLEQLADMMTLCRAASPAIGGYSPQCITLLKKYAPDHTLDFRGLTSLGFGSWHSLVQFVKDDDCIQLALMARRLVAQVWGAPVVKDQDFINGEGGLGFYERLVDRMKRHLEKAFDEKWLHQARRPLQYLRDVIGIDAAMANVHYAHPAHPRYPAGHGVKFAVSFDYIMDSYELTETQVNQVFTVFYAASMARSGAGVHLPEDNVASWSLVANRAIGKYKD